MKSISPTDAVIGTSYTGVDSSKRLSSNVRVYVNEWWAGTYTRSARSSNRRRPSLLPRVLWDGAIKEDNLCKSLKCTLNNKLCFPLSYVYIRHDPITWVRVSENSSVNGTLERNEEEGTAGWKNCETSSFLIRLKRLNMGRDCRAHCGSKKWIQFLFENSEIREH
jgi:hypothetical protein